MSDTPANPPAPKTNLPFSEREALLYHSAGRPGKIEIVASKPMATQRDLRSLIHLGLRCRCKPSLTIPRPPMIIPRRVIWWP